MKKFLLCVAIGSIACGFAFSAPEKGAPAKEAAVKPAQNPAPPSIGEARQPTDVASCEDEVVLFENPFSSVEASTKSNCCISRCRRDRDCDSVCGLPGAGVCLQVNSCCRDCACTA